MDLDAKQLQPVPLDAVAAMCVELDQEAMANLLGWRLLAELQNPQLVALAWDRNLAHNLHHQLVRIVRYSRRPGTLAERLHRWVNAPLEVW